MKKILSILILLIIIVGAGRADVSATTWTQTSRTNNAAYAPLGYDQDMINGDMTLLGMDSTVTTGSMSVFRYIHNESTITHNNRALRPHLTAWGTGVGFIQHTNGMFQTPTLIRAQLYRLNSFDNGEITIIKTYVIDDSSVVALVHGGEQLTISQSDRTVQFKTVVRLSRNLLGGGETWRVTTTMMNAGNETHSQATTLGAAVEPEKIRKPVDIIRGTYGGGGGGGTLSAPTLTIRFGTGATNTSGSSIANTNYSSSSNNDGGESGWTRHPLNLTLTPPSGVPSQYWANIAINTSGWGTYADSGPVILNDYHTETTVTNRTVGTPVFGIIRGYTGSYPDLSYPTATQRIFLDKTPPIAHVSYNSGTKTFSTTGSSDALSGLSTTRPVRVAVTTSSSNTPPADSQFFAPTAVTAPTTPGTYYMWAMATDRAGNVTRTRMSATIVIAQPVPTTPPTVTIRYAAGETNKAGTDIGGRAYSKENSVTNNDDGEDGWTNNRLEIIVTPPGGGGSSWINMGTVNSRLEYEDVQPGVKSWIKAFDDKTGSHEDTPEYLFPDSSTTGVSTLHRYVGPFTHPNGTTMNGHVNLGTSVMAMWESIGGTNGTSGSASWTRYYKFDPSRITELRAYGRTFTVVPGADRIEIVTNITTSVTSGGVTSNTVTAYARYNGVSSTTRSWSGHPIATTSLGSDVEYKTAAGATNFRTVLNINGSVAATNTSGGAASVNNFITNTTTGNRRDGTPLFGVLTQQTSPFTELTGRRERYIKIDTVAPTAHVAYNNATRQFNVSGSNDALSGLSHMHPVKVALTPTTSAPADSAYQHWGSHPVPTSGTYYMWAWATDKAGNETKTRMSTPVTFAKESAPGLDIRYVAGTTNKAGINIGNSLYTKINSVANNDDGEDGWTNKRLNITVTPPGGGAASWVNMGTVNARLELEDMEPGVKSWIKVFDDATGAHVDTPEYLFSASSTTGTGTVHRYVGPFRHPNGNTINGHVNLGTSVLALWESIGGVNGTSGNASWTRYYKFDPARISQIRVYGRTFTVVPGQDRIEIVTNYSTSVSGAGVTTNVVSTYARYNGVSSTTQTWTGSGVPGTALASNVEYRVEASNNFRTVLNINGSVAATNDSGGVASVTNYGTNTQLAHRANGTEVFGVLTERTSPFAELSDKAYSYIKLDTVSPVAHATYNDVTRKFDVSGSSDTLSGLSNTRPVRIALTTTTSAPADSEYQHWNTYPIPNSGTRHIWVWATDKAGNETKTRMTPAVTFTSETVGDPTLVIRYMPATLNKAGANIGGELYSKSNSVMNNDDGEEGWTNKPLEVSVIPPGGGGATWINMGTVNARIEYEDVQPGVKSWIKVSDDETGNHADTPEYLFSESFTTGTGTLHRYVGPFLHPNGDQMSGHVNLGTSVLAMWESIGGVSNTSGAASWTRFYKFDPSRTSQIRVYGTTFNVVPGQDRVRIITNITTTVSSAGVTTNVMSTYATYNGVNTATQTWTGFPVAGTILASDVEYRMETSNNFRTVLNINGSVANTNNSGGIASVSNYLTNTQLAHRVNGTEVFGVLTERTSPFTELSNRVHAYIKLDTVPPVAHATYNDVTRKFDISGSGDTLSGLSNIRPVKIALTTTTSAPADSAYQNWNTYPIPNSGTRHIWVWATDKAGNETKTRMTPTVTFTSETVGTPTLTMRYMPGTTNKAGVNIGGELYSKSDSVMNNDDGEDGWTNKQLEIAVIPPGGGGATWINMGTVNARIEYEDVQPGVKSWIKVSDDETGDHADTPEYLFSESFTTGTGTLHRYVGPFLHPNGDQMSGHVNLGTSVLAMWESIGGVSNTSGAASWTRFYKFDPSRTTQIRVYGTTFNVVPGQDRVRIITNITTTVSSAGVTTNVMSAYATYNGVNTPTQTWTGFPVAGTALASDVEYRMETSTNFRTVLNINGSVANTNNSGGIASVSNYWTNTQLAHRIDGTEVYGVLTQPVSPFAELSTRVQGHVKLDRDPPVAHVAYDPADRSFNTQNSTDALSGMSNIRPVKVALTTTTSAPADSAYRSLNDLTVPSTGTYYMWAWAIDRAGNETKTRMLSPVNFAVGTPTITIKYPSGTVNRAGVNIGGNLYSPTNSVANNDDGEEGWTNKNLDIAVIPPAGLAPSMSAWVKMGTVNNRIEFENIQPGVKSRMKIFDDRTGMHEDTPEYLFPDSFTTASGSFHRYVGPFLHPNGDQMSGHVNLGESVMALWERMNGASDTNGSASWTRFYKFDPTRVTELRVFGITFTVVPGADRVQIITNVTAMRSGSTVTNTITTYARYNGVSTPTQTWSGGDVVPGTNIRSDVEYKVEVGNNLRTLLLINDLEEAVNNNGGIATRYNYALSTPLALRTTGSQIIGVMTERESPFTEVSPRAYATAFIDKIPPTARGTYHVSTGTFTDESNDDLSGISNTRKTQIAFTPQSQFITPPDSEFHDYDTPPTLEPGFYRLHVKAFDKAGNVGNWVNTTSIIIVIPVQTVETTFTKVGADNVNIGLSGAEFALYRWNGAEQPTAAQRNQIVDSTQLIDGNWTRVKYNGVDATSLGDIFTSTATGAVNFGDLITDTYTLIETKSPTGYDLPVGQWTVTIDAGKNDTSGNWKIEFAAKSQSIMPPAAIRDESIPNAPTYKIINTEPFSIGMSGLAGTSGMILIGFVVMAIAGNAYIIMNKKRRSRTRRR